MNNSSQTQRRINYGIDAPSACLALSAIGLALILAGGLIPHLRLSFWTTAIGFLLPAFGMLCYSLWGKYRYRERLLNMVSWHGGEHVLDVGTGQGLLLNGAAKRLTSGKAIGIDIWSKRDLSNNRADALLGNARLEGVEDRVEVRSEPAQALTFADNSFDLIFSNLCLHNLPDSEQRERACREMVRVLKPGGTIVLSDLAYTRTYAKIFRSLSCKTVRKGPFWFATFPPLSVVLASKG